MKHRKSSRRYSKARRTRARRGGLQCISCRRDMQSVQNLGEECLSCSSNSNGWLFGTRKT